jgi:putative PIN family toxin of toxin-antitoxin system
MKAVLDTNVLISALFFGGTPSTIIEAFARKKLHLIASPSILSEYRNVAERMNRRRPTDYKTTLEWIIANARVVADTDLGESVCADPADNKFIAAALASGAMIICSRG